MQLNAYNTLIGKLIIKLRNNIGTIALCLNRAKYDLCNRQPVKEPGVY